MRITHFEDENRVLFEDESTDYLSTVRNAVQQKVDLKGANLGGASLSGARLQEVDFRGVNLSGAYLNGSVLDFADLRGAFLRGSYLTGTKLWEANLEGADLSGSHSLNALLGGANLKGADLSYSNLEGADLEGADIRGTNLEEADLRDTDLRSVKWNDKTRLTGVQVDRRTQMDRGFLLYLHGHKEYSEDTEKLLQELKRYLEEGRIDQARRVFRQIPGMYPLVEPKADSSDKKSSCAATIQGEEWLFKL